MQSKGAQLEEFFRAPDGSPRVNELADGLDPVQKAIASDRVLWNITCVSERNSYAVRFAHPSEKEILDFVAAGLLDKQIADEARTSELTVKIYRAHIIEKTRPDSLAHVARMAEKLKAIVRE